MDISDWFLFMTATRTIASSSLHALILDDSHHVSEHFYVRQVYLHHWWSLTSRSHKWRLPLYTAQFNNSSTCLDKVRSGISSCKKLSLGARNMDQSIILSFPCDGYNLNGISDLLAICERVAIYLKTKFYCY